MCKQYGFGFTGKKGKGAAEEDDPKGKGIAAPKGKAKGSVKGAGKGSAKPSSAVKGKAASKKSPAKPKKRMRKVI